MKVLLPLSKIIPEDLLNIHRGFLLEDNLYEAPKLPIKEKSFSFIYN